MSLHTIHRWLQKSYLRIITSIAFIPSLLACGFLLLSLWTLYIDESSPEKLISYSVSVQNIIHPDSARALLSAITGGMISLMVFSFSMVMIVLSQTASNYSPRVLPNLIGQRFHQVVMGTYLGTILYTIIVLSSIQSKLYAFDVPHLSIVLSTLFGLISLAMFVAFVHSISQHIQIGSIIRNLYSDTLKSLSSYLKNTESITEDELPSAQTWVSINCPVSGYLFGMNKSALKKFCQETDIMVWMALPWGVYVHRWQPLLRVSRQLSEEEKKRLVNIFIFESDEILSQNYAVGFKQLTEIAVKALSPGINDPGTAIEAIDQLATLFTRQMEAQEVPVIKDNQNRLRWIGRPISFEELFTWCWTAIKDYAAQDTVVLYKLIEWLETMVHSDATHHYTSILTSTLSDLIDHIQLNVKSSVDQQNLYQRIQQLLQRSSNRALNKAIQEKISEQWSEASV
uniref:DUF2254 domain-containing protein n=1 Tax=Roseihalotalea indica TaxID=2867963 RepID=A0AA49JH62_9BACT|nr:DUF2254 domain-containing protein [Tunicatimonas sp. TK19036]